MENDQSGVGRGRRGVGRRRKWWGESAQPVKSGGETVHVGGKGLLCTHRQGLNTGKRATLMLNINLTGCRGITREISHQNKESVFPYRSSGGNVISERLNEKARQERYRKRGAKKKNGVRALFTTKKLASKQ